MRKYFFVYIWPLLLIFSIILFALSMAVDAFVGFGPIGIVLVSLFTLFAFIGAFFGTLGTFIVAPIVLFVIMFKSNEQNTPASPPQNP